MNIHRLSDWLKLSSMLVAAALLAGCDGAGDDAVPAGDAPFGAESTFDDADTGDVMIEDDVYDVDLEPSVIDSEPTVDAPVVDEPIAEPTAEPETP